MLNIVFQYCLYKTSQVMWNAHFDLRFTVWRLKKLQIIFFTQLDFYLQFLISPFYFSKLNFLFAIFLFIYFFYLFNFLFNFWDFKCLKFFWSMLYFLFAGLFHVASTYGQIDSTDINHYNLENHSCLEHTKVQFKQFTVKCHS